jgi:hypothetical protein
MHRRDEKCIQGLVGECEGKRALGRPRRRWEAILEWILGKQGERCGTDVSGSG